MASAVIGAVSPAADHAVRELSGEYRIFHKFRPVLDYLARTAPGRMRVGEMAERMGMSQAAFSRRFTATTGVTPKAFIEGIYLAKARELLLFSPKTVDEIASELGHEHTHYFHTVFPRLTGMTPGEFRAKNIEHHKI